MSTQEDRKNVYRCEIEAFRGLDIGEGMSVRERDRLLAKRQAAQDAQAYWRWTVEYR